MIRAIGSAGERLVHTEEVTGSIPVSPTKLTGRFRSWKPAFLIFRQQQTAATSDGSGKRWRPSSGSQLFAESAERFARGLGRDLGVDLHRDGDLLRRRMRIATRGWTSRAASNVAQVLRVTCSVILGTRAATIMRSKLRLKLRGSIGVPCLVVKIRPVSIQPSPALAFVGPLHLLHADTTLTRLARTRRNPVRRPG
jgi:hypothetical protein